MPELSPCELATVLIFGWFFGGVLSYFVAWGFKGAGQFSKTLDH